MSFKEVFGKVIEEAKISSWENIDKEITKFLQGYKRRSKNDNEVEWSQQNETKQMSKNSLEQFFLSLGFRIINRNYGSKSYGGSTNWSFHMDNAGPSATWRLYMSSNTGNTIKDVEMSLYIDNS